MKRLGVLIALWLFAGLPTLPEAGAQKQPDIGYLFPAGGERGHGVDVTVGGQFLAGVDGVYVVGEGVQAEVVEYRKPVPRNVLNQLAQKCRELNRRRQDHQINWLELNAEFTAFARSKKLPEMNLETFNKMRLKLRDPKRQPNPQLEEQVKLHLTIDDDAMPGGRELRLETALGLSNPMVFQVGQYPEVRESEPNDQADAGQKIEALPTVINGQVLPGDVDCFRFFARRGIRLVAMVEARRLIPYLADAVPGWFQATLSLRDAKGQEVAFSDDFGFHPDPAFCYKIPRDGQYVLAIHDAIFRGREDFVYRITLGEVPMITSMFPLGGEIDQNTTVRLNGWNLSPRNLKVKTEGKQAGFTLLSTRGGKWESNQFPFALGTLNGIHEAEPNDQPDQAQSVALPLMVNGRIGQSGDRDVYRFIGRQGQRLVAEIQARRLGSELDSLLQLTDAKGQRLSSNDDFQDKGAGLITHQADSLLQFTLPGAGTYFVSVSDTQNHGGEAYGYRLRLSAPQPDFKLRVVPSSINARPGMTVPLTVYALRRDGYEGQIDLRLVAMPSGFSISGGRIPAQQDKVQISLSVPGTPQEEPVPLHLEGWATIDGQEVRHAAVPADDMMQAFLYRHLVPMRQSLVSVQGRSRRGKPLRLLDPLPVELPVQGTAQIRLAAPKGPLLDALQLEVRDPTKGISVRKVSSDPAGWRIALTIQGDSIQVGQQGNLIIEAFRNWSRKGRDGKKKNRRVSLGILPAIPYDIVELGGVDAE